MSISLDRLLTLCGIPCSGPVPDMPVLDLTDDSRSAREGSLFVCLPGYRTDGHRYAPDAYASGCRMFLAERPLGLPADAIEIRVPDTASALADLAAAFFGFPSQGLSLTGITGTKGKTTQAWLLHELFNRSGLKAGYIGTMGAFWPGHSVRTSNTTPDALRLQRIFKAMRDDGVTHVALEISSQALMTKRIRGLSFDTVVFTNLYRDHIGPGEHKSFEDYRDAKRSLFTEYAARTGIFNGDDPYSGYMRKGFLGRTVLTGRDPGSDYRILSPEQPEPAFGISFELERGEIRYPVRSPMPGAFNESNLAQVLAAASSAGLDLRASSEHLVGLSVPGRMEPVPFRPGIHVVIDYAHNGPSLRAALSTLRPMTKGRLIVLFGSVGERTYERRAELAHAASELADACVLTSDNPGQEDPYKILQDISRELSRGFPRILIPDREEAIRTVLGELHEGDTLLLAGKGHEDYQLIGDRRIPFCERAVVESFPD